MKFTEPINGYKQAAGETLFHVVFFITMFFLDFGPCYAQGSGELQSQYNFQTLCYFMWFVHLFRIVKIVIEFTFPANFRAQFLVATLIEVISICLYIGATFFNQNMYFTYYEEQDQDYWCDDSKIGISEYWILIEIIVFYMQIGTSMLSILLAQIFLPENLKDHITQKNHQEEKDYMKAYESYILLLQLYSSGIVITITGIEAETEYEKYTTLTDDQLAKGSYHSLMKTIQYWSFFSFFTFNILTIKGKEMSSQSGIGPTFSAFVNAFVIPALCVYYLIFVGNNGELVLQAVAIAQMQINFLVFPYLAFNEYFKRVKKNKPKHGTGSDKTSFEEVVCEKHYGKQLQDHKEKERGQHSIQNQDSNQVVEENKPGEINSIRDVINAFQVAKEKQKLDKQSNKKEIEEKEHQKRLQNGQLYEAHMREHDPEYRRCEKSGLERLKEGKEIEVEFDWYWITFAGFNTDVFFKANLTPEEVTNNMLSCYFIFGLQFILLFFIAIEQTDLDYFCQVATDITIVRFCSCAMLHTMIMGEIRSALEKLKYVCDHDQHFMCENQAALCCVMQFLIGLCTELFSICLVCHQAESEDVIILFIALAIIADIDNFYASSSGEHKLNEENLKKFFPEIIHTHKKYQENVDFTVDDLGNVISETAYKSKRSTWSKCCRVLYKGLRLLFAVIYYYYMPFFVVPLSYIIPYYYEYNINLSEEEIEVNVENCEINSG